MSFLTLREANANHYEIKRSQFKAYAALAENREQALDIVEQQRSLYPDARHHCWAYLIGDPKQASTMAMSDDGEPSGTAGKPILNVLQHSNIGNIVVVVSRYFGGVKLGAGGLVRAYSKATQLVIDACETIENIEYAKVCITCDFAQEQFLRHSLQTLEARVINNQYTEQVLLEVEFPIAFESKLKTLCTKHGYVLQD